MWRRLLGLDNVGEGALKIATGHVGEGAFQTLAGISGLTQAPLTWPIATAATMETGPSKPLIYNLGGWKFRMRKFSSCDHGKVPFGITFVSFTWMNRENYHQPNEKGEPTGESIKEHEVRHVPQSVFLGPLYEAIGAVDLFFGAGGVGLTSGTIVTPILDATRPRGGMWKE